MNSLTFNFFSRGPAKGSAVPATLTSPAGSFVPVPAEEVPPVLSQLVADAFVASTESMDGPFDFGLDPEFDFVLEGPLAGCEGYEARATEACSQASSPVHNQLQANRSGIVHRALLKMAS